MQFVNINGHTIHYGYFPCTSLAIEGRDRTFLFINSLGTDFRIWDGVVQELKDFGNILLFDKGGHGLSDVVEDSIDLKDFAEDAIALMEYLSIKKCIPVGLSVGGMISILLANRIPEKIEKLILCDTAHIIGNAEIWNDRINAVKAKGLSSISDAVMQRWFSEEFRKENPIKVSGYKNMLDRMPAIGYIKTCEAIRDADLTALAKQIRVASLCVVGSEDRSTMPEEVKGLADLIPGSTYEVIEGSGHIPCVDNPEQLSKVIIDFIKE